MEIIKKNLVSIIFGVIAIAAVVASFWPLGGYFTELQSDVTKREAQFKKAKEIFSKRHTLPLTSLGKDGQPQDLGVFPMPKITQDAKEYMNALVKESTGVFKAAMLMNIAECVVNSAAKDDAGKLLLTPKSLPIPEGSQDDEFKKSLPPEVERMRTKILNGGFPPSPEEMTQAVQDLNAKFDKKRIKDANGQAFNEEAVAAALATATAALPNEMRDRVALGHTIYVDPTAIVVPADFSSPTPLSPERIFYAQAQLWAEEDICRAIAEVNAKAKNVTDAPVKRLLHLDVPFGPAMYLRPAADASAPGAAADPGIGMRGGRMDMPMTGGVGGPNNKPPPLPSEKQDYSLTPTGRTSNALYDVVNINLDVHIDATKIPQLLSALSRSRLVTVRNISFSRVDNNDMQQQNFVYGSAPVADLVLDLEQLQMREWTTQFMPVQVKALVGATDWVSELNPTAQQKSAAPVRPAAGPVTPARSRLAD